MLGGTSGISSLYTAANAGLSGSLDLSRLSKYGLTDRALAQSLLMSTATPMVAPGGYIYSPMQQGAGLANVSERLRLQYGSACAFRMESTPLDGTCIYLELPVGTPGKA